MEPITGTPSETISAELDAVLQEGVRVAADYLGRLDTFLPFALLFRPDDKLERIEVARTDGSTDLDSQEAYDALVAALGDRVADLHAIGVITDVQISREGEPPLEAVRVELEHRDVQGRVLTVLAAYDRADGGSPTFEEQLRTHDSDRRFWV